MNAPVERIDKLLDRSWGRMISQPIEALAYAQQALSGAASDAVRYCEAKSFVGLCNIYLGQFDTAITELNEALPLAVGDAQQDNARRINNALGMSYQALGHYAVALDHYELTTEIARRSGAAVAVIPPLTNMAILMFEMGDAQSAETILNEVLGFDFDGVTQDNLVEVYLLLAQILLNQLNIEEAQLVLDQAQRLAVDLDFKLGLLRSRVIQGRLTRLEGKLELALTLLSQTIADEDFASDGSAGLMAYIEIAKAQFSLAQNDQALATLHASLHRLKPPEESPHRLKVLEQLAFGYQLTGDQANELLMIKQMRAIESSSQARQSKNLLNLRKFKRQQDQEQLNRQLIDKENQLLKQSYERLSLLNDIAHQVAMTLDFSELGQRLYAILAKHLDVHFISLLTVDETEQEMTFRFVIDVGQLIDGSAIPLNRSGSSSAEAYQSKKPVIINNAEPSSENPNQIGDLTILPQSLLFVPLILDEDVIGIFSMQSPVLNRFKDYELHLMIAICKFMAIAVTNIVSHEEVQQLNRSLFAEKQLIEDAQERIAHMAYHDSLTALPNRQALEEFIERRIDQQRRPFHLVYIDLDGFKQVNDRYGHRVGDRVLIELGQRIKASLRQRDFAARVGGDEFVLIVDEFASVADQQAFLTRLLVAIELAIQTPEATLFLSASIGSALYPAKGKNLDELMHSADSAMYLNKRQGKSGLANGLSTEDQ